MKNYLQILSELWNLAANNLSVIINVGLTVLNIWSRFRENALRRSFEKRMQAKQAEYSENIEKLKSELNKEVEGYKHQLQVEVIKAKLKIDRLFSIYPKLLFQLRLIKALINKSLQTHNGKLPADLEVKMNEAVRCIEENLPFISNEVEENFDKFFNEYQDFSSTDSEQKANERLDKMRQITKTLQKQIKKEMGTDL